MVFFNCPPSSFFQVVSKVPLFQYGWYVDEEGNLKPTMVPDGTAMAPKAVLDITRCNCTGKTYDNVQIKFINKNAGTNCKNNHCSCSRSCLPCSEFCKCHERGCENRFSKKSVLLAESEDDEEERTLID